MVVETKIEHGFCVSQIDLGLPMQRGARFRNAYRARLENSFTAEEEHWTQEIARPTQHLTLRIHFPSERPPKLVRCKRVIGLIDLPAGPQAITTELFSRPAILWEIPNPKLGEIYKLEWRW